MSQRRAIRGGLTVSATLLFAPLCLAQSPEPRPWSLSLRTFVVHDSNVPLAATDTTFAGSSASNVVGLALAGDYRFYRDAKWTVRSM